MTPTSSPFVEYVLGELRTAGLEASAILSVRADTRPEGDAIVVVKVGGFRLKVTRDRAQIWVDVAVDRESPTFYQFGDLETALGWRTSKDPEIPIPGLSTVLLRLASRWLDLEEAFRAANVGATTDALNVAVRRRREWMGRRLDSISTRADG